MEIVSVQYCLAKLTAGSTHWQKEMVLHYQRRWEGSCNFNSFSSVFKSPEVLPHVVRGSLGWAVLGCVDSVSFLSSSLSLDRPERWDTNPGCYRPKGRAFQIDSPSALQTVELKHEGMKKIQQGWTNPMRPQKNVFIWESWELCHLPLAPSHTQWAKTGGLRGWETHEDMRGSVNGTLLLAHERVQCSTMGYCAAEEVVPRVRHYTHKTQWRSWPLCGH